MSYCPNCGRENTEANKFCIHCGAKLASPSGFNDGGRGDFRNDPGRRAPEYDTRDTEEIIYTSAVPRSIVMCVILTIVTFGIYSIVWMCRLNRDINEMSGDSNAPGGFLLVLFVFLTLGIYHLYWLYKMGEKCERITSLNSHSNIIYLILGLVGLGIVSYALMQDTINRSLE